MVRRPTRLSRLDASKSQSAQLELIDEYIDDSNWIVCANVVLKTFGKQSDLLAVLAFNESLHTTPPCSNVLRQFKQQ